MHTFVRAANDRDHAAYVRLAPELGTGDPLLEEPRFVSEMVPTTRIAEDEGGSAVGYAYFRIMNATAYIVNVVSAPEARRCGVGRALLEAVARAARRRGCTTWSLNVKPDNEAALALYERMGLTRAFESRALRIEWANVFAPESRSDGDRVVRAISPEDDARVEAAMGLVDGQLAAARTFGDRVLLSMEEGRDVVGAAVFNPHFPGAYPFRVARPDLALGFLRAIRPFAREADMVVNVVVEARLDVADALVAAGAVVHLELVCMNGSLSS